MDGWMDGQMDRQIVGQMDDPNGHIFRERRIYLARSQLRRFDHSSKKLIKNTRCKNYDCIKVKKMSVLGQHFELLLKSESSPHHGIKLNTIYIFRLMPL